MKWLQGVGTAADCNQYLGAGSALSTNAGRVYCLQRLRFGGGLHVFDQFRARHSLTANLTEAWWAIYRKDGTTFTRVASTEATIPATATTTQTTNAVNLPVLLEDGAEYYYGLVMQRSAGASAGHCGIRVSLPGFSPTPLGVTGTDVYVITLSDASFGTGLDDTFETTDGSTPRSYNGSYAMDCRASSVNGVIATGPAFTAGTPLGIELPRPHDGRAFVVFDDVKVGANDILQITFRGTSTTTTTASHTITVDMTDGSEDITVGANAVSLPDLNSLAQAGDTFRIAVGMEANDGGIDVYWQNLTKGFGGQDTVGTSGYRDITTMSHECAVDAARGGLKTGNNPRIVHITRTSGSGTTTIGGIKVVDAAKLYILLGDSQTGGKSSANNPPTAAYLNRLGSAIEEITDGVMWNAGIAGSRFDENAGTQSTAGKTRYSGTIGTHDLVEMVDKSGATLLYMGMGINDISVNVSNDATAISEPANIAASLETFVADTGNGTAALFGLPPYSDSNASAFDSTAVRNLNDQLFALATEYSIGFVSPWAAMWDGTINANGAYVFNTDYTDDDLHYNTTGADIAAALLEDAVGGERSNAGNSRGGPRTRSRTRTRQC